MCKNYVCALYLPATSYCAPGSMHLTSPSSPPSSAPSPWVWSCHRPGLQRLQSLTCTPAILIGLRWGSLRMTTKTRCNISGKIGRPNPFSVSSPPPPSHNDHHLNHIPEISQIICNSGFALLSAPVPIHQELVVVSAFFHLVMIMKIMMVSDHWSR